MKDPPSWVSSTNRAFSSEAKGFDTSTNILVHIIL